MNAITTLAAITLNALSLRHPAISPAATLRWALALLLAAVLSGCGGGGSSSSTDPLPVEPGSGQPAPGATAIGTPIGSAISQVVGPAGGQLSTADGGLTVIVPPGAFSKQETLRIQEISNELHGTPGRVTASVELLDPSMPNAQRLLLVSNITVTDEVRSCEWLRSAATLAFDVSYDPYSFSASQGIETYEGHSSGNLHGTLVNLMPPGNTTRYGAWLSETATAQGQASMSDSHQFGDGKTRVTWDGSGAAFTGTPGSAMALNVDYERCTYSVVASFWVATLETTTYDRETTTQRVLSQTAIFGAKDLPIILPVKVAAEMDARPMLDLDGVASGAAGFVPEGQSESLRATPQARVRWNIVKP